MIELKPHFLPDAESDSMVAGLIWHQDECLIIREDLSISLWSSSNLSVVRKIESSEQLIGWPNNNNSNNGNSSSNNASSGFNRIFPTTMSQNPMVISFSSLKSGNSTSGGIGNSYLTSGSSATTNLAINNNGGEVGISMPTADSSRSGEALNTALGAVNLDGLVIGATDGNLYWLGKSNRIEKTIRGAHAGSVLVTRWSNDGNSLISAGEDGIIKVWSRSGMLRTSLSTNSSGGNGPVDSCPVMALAWSPRSDKIVFASRDYVVIKGVASTTASSIPQQQQQQQGQQGSNNPSSSTASSSFMGKSWRAHENSLILTVDWHGDKLITGAEDCRIKIWDEMGRCLFASFGNGGPLSSSMLSSSSSSGSDQGGQPILELRMPASRIAFSPDGSRLAIGSFDSLYLLDSGGGYFLSSLDIPGFGSPQKVSWHNNRVVALCGSRGSIAIVHVIGDTLVWRGLECTLVGERRLSLLDARTADSNASSAPPAEILEFRDLVTDFSLLYGYLLVTTSNRQLHVYLQGHWNTPNIIDLPSHVISVRGHEKYVTVCDRVQGISVYNLVDSKLMCTVKIASLNVGTTTSSALLDLDWDLAGDVLVVKEPAVFNRSQGILLNQLSYYDVFTGGKTTVNSNTNTNSSSNNSSGGFLPGVEIKKISLDKSNFTSGSASNRLLALLDGQRNVRICPLSSVVHGSSLPMILCTNVIDFMWHASHPILITLDEQCIKIWYCPFVLFNDLDLKELVMLERSTLALGKSFQLSSATGQIVTLCKENGASLYFMLPGYVTLIYDLVKKGNWEACIKLARYFQADRTVWALLACLALNQQGNQIFLSNTTNTSNSSSSTSATSLELLNTAEVCYAALDEIAKVQHICQLKQQIQSSSNSPTEALERAADLILFRTRSYEQAEAFLLANNKPALAIELALRLYRYGRALQLSDKFGQLGRAEILAARERDLLKMGISQSMPHKKSNDELINNSSDFNGGGDRGDNENQLQLNDQNGASLNSLK